MFMVTIFVHLAEETLNVSSGAAVPYQVYVGHRHRRSPPQYLSQSP
jgi:hypothetical protein